MGPIRRNFSFLSTLEGKERIKKASLDIAVVKEASISGDFGEEKKQILTKYMVGPNSFQPVGDIQTIATLSPGLYMVTPTMQGPRFDKHAMKTDEIISFEDSRYNKVLSEIDKFWDLKEKFATYGFAHKRGILLYGAPGTGKSCLLKQIMDASIKKGHVVLICKSPHDLVDGVKAFREVEKERKALVILEDIDELVRWDEHSILQLFDGDAQTDNVLYLATTNYIDRLPARMLRPSRLDRKIEVDNPPITGRYAYLKHKLGHIEEDSAIQKLAEKTDGFSFAQLKEVVIAKFCLGDDEETTIQRIRDNLEPS